MKLSNPITPAAIKASAAACEDDKLNPLPAAHGAKVRDGRHTQTRYMLTND